jgi:NADPH2:quinone reductase
VRAVVCHELKGVVGLRYELDWDEPRAGQGQLLLDVRSSALNFPDVLMVQGLYQDKPPLPFVVGTEFSGVVSALGEGVSGFNVGDRVVSAAGRCLAERVAVDASRVIPAPKGLDFDAASGICITYSTTMHALKQRAALQPSETMLVLGAAGGVGTTAVELGKAMGARVIAAASSEAKLALTRDLGADATINYLTEDLRERIKQLTNGKGVDVVYDPVGSSLAESALRSMAWRGRYLVIGFAGGDIPRIPLNLPLLKGCAIVGVYWGSFAQREPDVQAANVAELWEHFERGRLKPIVGEVHALPQFGEAFSSLMTRRARGKVVLRISS